VLSLAGFAGRSRAGFAGRIPGMMGRRARMRGTVLKGPPVQGGLRESEDRQSGLWREPEVEKASLSPVWRESVTYDSADAQRPLLDAFGNLWRYRALLRLLVIRELTVRYKRSLLGVSWTLLNPLLTSLVMWAVFNAVFHPSIPGNVPYIIYLMSGVLVVTFFQQGVQMTGASMASSAGILTKVYVPPVVFAVSAAMAGAVNFLLGLVPLILLQIILLHSVPWTYILVPVPLLFLGGLVAGVGLIVATLQIQFNDILDLTNVLLYLIGYLTPTFYPITIIPKAYRHFLLLNPLFSFVDVFRHFEYGGTLPPVLTSTLSVVMGVVGLLVGLKIFVVRWPRVAARL